ncbi:MAG: OmpH family outer membrane protein [Bacteroidota bacterium]
MMYRKTLSLLFAALFFFSLDANAQKIAFVDVQEILENIAEYQEAQAELDRMANQWRQEIAQEYDVIKGMYNRYQAEQVLLSEDARNQREDEIMNKEKEVRDMQRDRFGPEGQLFKRRQELVQPIQERVYSAIEAYANERGYDFIFDRSSDSGMIFTNPQYNKTEEILRRL